MGFISTEQHYDNLGRQISSIMCYVSGVISAIKAPSPWRTSHMHVHRHIHAQAGKKVNK